MCQPHVSREYQHFAGCNCGYCGCGCGPALRSFLTSQEQLERLKSYRDHLEKELAGVQEQIGEIRQV